MQTATQKINDDDSEIFARIKAGNMEARNAFVERNLALVTHTIKQMHLSNPDYEELFQVGSIGLIKAVNKFDPELGFQFATYAVPMIQGEIRRFLRDHGGLLKVPRSIRDIAYKSWVFRKEYEKKHNKEPTMEEMAKALDTSMDKLLLAREALIEPQLLSAPVYSDKNGNETLVIDTLFDEKPTEENWTDNIALRDSLDILNESECNIVLHRFWGDKSQMDVAKTVNRSQALVSRLEKRALDKLKDYFTDKGGRYKVKAKITPEQLLEECRIHGTGMAGRTIIAEKYGMTPGSVSVKMAHYGVVKKLKGKDSADTAKDEKPADMLMTAAINVKTPEAIEIITTSPAIVAKVPEEVKSCIILLSKAWAGKELTYTLSGDKYTISTEAGNIKVSDIDAMIAELNEVKGMRLDA